MKVLGWWGVQSVLPKDVFGLAEAVVFGINGGCMRDLGALIFLVTAWFMWFWRNLKVFGTGDMFEEGILDSIQSKSFLWLKSKEQGCDFSYTDWILRPLECRNAIVQHGKNLKSYKKLHRVMNQGEL
ncbi:hypothetical protein SLA2020_069060 [Shorea laevis]